MIITQQTLFFLSVCGLGASLGFLYDIFRVQRATIKTCNVIIWLEDIIFFIIATLSTFYFLILKNYGEFRFFLLLGEIAGAIVYFGLLSDIIFTILTYVINLIKKVIFFINKIAFVPIIKVYTFFCSKISNYYVKKQQLKEIK